jgi:DNA repair photolyase
MSSLHPMILTHPQAFWLPSPYGQATFRVHASHLADPVFPYFVARSIHEAMKERAQRYTIETREVTSVI